jgi:osmoprotectant transport system ATP-binding protein
VIRFEHLTKKFGSTLAVTDLSLEVDEGEIVMLLGPSGCGKTTTLKMVNRLIEPTSGKILVAGQDTSQVDPVRLRRGIGYVIQQSGLFPHMTVADNIGTVPRLLGWKESRILARVRELLELVGLDPDSDFTRLPRELSGGQAQRVGVARALAADPPVMLMDEPFGALDPLTRERLQEQLLRLQGIVRKTILFVSHDVEEAVRLGSRIALLNVGGVLEQYDTPVRLLGKPANDFVAGFMGRDRQLRRLSLLSIARAQLDPPAPSLPEIDRSDNLRSALDLLLETGARALAVRDGEQVAGTLTLDGILSMAKALS